VALMFAEELQLDAEMERAAKAADRDAATDAIRYFGVAFAAFLAAVLAIAGFGQ
jgi:hypothetical protein